MNTNELKPTTIAITTNQGIKVKKATFSHQTPQNILKQILEGRKDRWGRNTLDLIDSGWLETEYKPSLKQRIPILLEFMQQWEIKSLRVQGQFNLSQPQLLKICSIKFPNISYLDIRRCKISNIESLAFVNSPFLQKIVLTGNQITKASKTLTRLRFPHLQNIVLTFNYIIEIKLERCKQTTAGIEYDVFHQNKQIGEGPNKKVIAKMEICSDKIKMFQMLQERRRKKRVFIEQKKIIQSLYEKFC